MKLAYVSYAFPPDTAVGGIATYVDHVARAMCRRGHAVEVFCASPHRETLNERRADGVVVHRVRSADRASFGRDVVNCFAARHELIHFDLVESPEYGADGLLIKRRFPGLPMIVRCHPPSYFVKRLNRTHRAASWSERVKKALHIRQYKKLSDSEYQLVTLADGLASPSVSLRDHLATDWQLDRKLIGVLPYVFVPQEELLAIPAAGVTRVVTFLGRLEVRKGLVALSDAIPHATCTFALWARRGKPRRANGRWSTICGPSLPRTWPIWSSPAT